MRKCRMLILQILLMAYALTVAGKTGSLPRTEPERVGISSFEVIRLVDSLMSLPKTSIHSVMIIRNDSVVGEAYPSPWSKESLHTMYSCSKTFVAVAIGLAIEEHKLKLSSKVSDFFPQVRNLSPYYKKITVRDLLTMSSGITPDWTMRNDTDDWTTVWLSKPMIRPGKKFQYDSMCTYLLSAILQKVTGKSVLEYLRPRIFEPLDIDNVQWEISSEGYNTGGWGLLIQTESLAKFGLLLLHDGLWKGRQLIPAAWVRAMKEKEIDNGLYGYGYQMWCCEYPGASRADGAYGQYILLIPDKDMVVVITECSAIDGIRQRRLIWRQLLPSVSDTPLKSSQSAGLYHRRMDSYELPTAEGKAINDSLFAPHYFTLKKNDLEWSSISVRRSTSEGEILFSYVQKGDTVCLPIHNHVWSAVKTRVSPVYSIMARGRLHGINPVFTVAGSYGVSGDGILHVLLHYTDWISVVQLDIPLNSVSQKKIIFRLNHENARSVDFQ